jgi:hypothetical protein
MLKNVKYKDDFHFSTRSASGTWWKNRTLLWPLRNCNFCVTIYVIAENIKMHKQSYFFSKSTFLSDQSTYALTFLLKVTVWDIMTSKFNIYSKCIHLIWRSPRHSVLLNRKKGKTRKCSVDKEIKNQVDKAVSFISFIFVVVSTVGMILNTLPSVQATVGHPCLIEKRKCRKY